MKRIVWGVLMPLVLIAAAFALVPSFEEQRWLPAGAGELQLLVEASSAPSGRAGSPWPLYLIHLLCPATFVMLWALQRREMRGSHETTPAPAPSRGES